MGKLNVWSRHKRALSPIFATMLLAVIIIVFGTVTYYYSNNLTRTATNNYVNTLTNDQQSLSERIGFENVVYNSSSENLTVYIINYGSANNVQINSTFIYNVNHTIVGQPYSSSITLNPIYSGGPTPTPFAGNFLNVGQEAYFTIKSVAQSNGQPLQSGSLYTINLITKSGSSFDHDFTP